MKRYLVLLLVAFWICRATLAAEENRTPQASTMASAAADQLPSGPEVFKWSELPPLPQARAEVFAGSYDNVLIVAGGLGEKGHLDSILVLNRADGEWRPAGKLPHPMAGGVSMSTKHGVICLGGCDEQNFFSDAFLLRWDERTNTVLIDELPSLPEKRAFAAGTCLDETIFIAVGSRGYGHPQSLVTAWSMDLSKEKEGLYWKALPDFPGKSRRFAVGAGQDNRFLILGGETADGKPLALTRSACHDWTEFGFDYADSAMFEAR